MPSTTSSNDNRSSSTRGGELFAVVAFLLFTSLFVFCLFRMSNPPFESGLGNWPEVAFVLASLAASVSALARTLPLQNVLLVASSSFGFLFTLVLLNDITNVPFGHWTPGRVSSSQALWVLPCIWTTLILSSRAVAGVILRSFRADRVYGYKVLMLAVGLSAVSEFGLELFATRLANLWTWTHGGRELIWYGYPLISMLIWATVSLITGIMTTPGLINKSPAPKPPSFLNLWLWIVPNVFFIAAEVQLEFWGAVTINSLAVLIVLLAVGYFGRKTAFSGPGDRPS